MGGTTWDGRLRSVVRGLLLAVAVAGAWAALTCAETSPADREVAVTLAKGFLSDPDLVAGCRIMAGKDHAEGSRVSLLLASADAGSRADPGQIVVDTRTRRVLGYSAPTVRDPPDRVITAVVAREVALRFLRRHLSPEVFGPPYTTSLETTAEPGVSGTIDVAMSVGADGMRLPFGAVVGVCAWEPKVANVTFRALPASIPASHLPETEARVRARAVVAGQGIAGLVLGRASSQVGWDEDTDKLYRYWEFGVTTGQRAASVVVYEDRRFGEDMMTPLPPEATAPTSKCLFWDLEPSWTEPVAGRPSLLFRSSRRPIGWPSWRPVETSLCRVELRTGAVCCVRQGESERGNLAAHGAVGIAVVNTGGGSSLVVDLTTGSTAPGTTSKRSGFDFRVSPTGRYVAFTADRAGGDTDVFLAEFGPGGLQHQTRAAWVRGRDARPVIGPGDVFVYWVHETGGEAGHYRGRIYRSRLSERGQDATVPAVVSEEIEAPQSVQVFPDDQRLLLAYDDGRLLRLDLGSRQLRPVVLPELRDATVPNSEPLKPAKVALSPNGEWLAFNADLRVKGAKEYRRCIYVCRLDGSQLRRLSPLTDEPLPMYAPKATAR